MHRCLVAAALSTVWASFANASCPVRDFIFDDKIVFSSDDVVRVSVLSETLDVLSDEQKKKVDAGILVPGYFEGSYSQDQRRAILRRQERLLNFDLTEEARRTLIQSKLSDKSVDMYRACLETYGLIIRTPPHATENSEFFVYIKYDPGPEATAADMFVEGKPAIFITGGSVPDAFFPFIPKKIEKQQEVRVLVRRNVNETTEIVANIGMRSQSAVLPPINKRRLSFYVKKASLSSNSWAKKPSDYKEFCVDAADGEVLFPETARLVDSDVTPPNGLNKSALLPEKSTEFQTCASVQSQAFDDFTGGSVTSTLSVITAKLQ